QFMQQQGINKANLIGHSMGGKTVMEFALQHPIYVNKLVVVDIAPAEYDDGHSKIFQALFAANVQQATTREEVSAVLHQKLGNDETTIGFLMKGLARNENGQHFEWKFNLESLWENYDKISASIDSSKPFTGQTLFIKGEKSAYINGANYAGIERLFPKNELTEIPGSGHWVHADKPQQFLAVVTYFLQKA
ncbi:MAG TPA: alpha/beta fold hydrolase, partial [Chitinophagales bacterium]|nr:alpha/beta fold hydrolase [Chitinophagales bacterium]